MEEYFVCDLCSKWFDANKVEITDKNSVVIDKLVEVSNGEATLKPGVLEDAIEEAKDSSVVELPVLSATETVKFVTVPVASMDAGVETDKDLLIETSDVIIILDA